MIKNENYVLVQGFMINDLNLKGNELIIYAIIYSFSQIENQYFTGSLKYLCEWTNSTKQGVLKSLKSLIDKGLIEKKEEYVNNIKYCRYSIKQNLIGSKLSLIPVKQSLHNNKDNNINNNTNNNIYELVENNFGRILSPMEIEQINYWLEEYEPELLKHAIKIAVLNNAKNFNYVRGILNNWKSKGIKTLNEVLEPKIEKENDEIIEIPDYDWLNEEG